MTDIVERRFEAIRRLLRPVPAIQPGICSVCRTGVERPYDHCPACRRHQDLSILPISMSNHGEGLHDRLRKYKRSPDPEVRRTMTDDLAVTVAMFLRHHSGCLGGEAQALAIPPPTRQSWGPHKIAERIRALVGLENCVAWAAPVERPVRVASDVAGRDVLVLDDTFTSGRHSVFPVARALQAAGATILGPLVIGRHFRPDWGENRAIYNKLRSLPYDGHSCARCAGHVFDPPLRELPPNTLL